jgi:hypothetical protein
VSGPTVTGGFRAVDLRRLVLKAVRQAGRTMTPDALAGELGLPEDDPGLADAVRVLVASGALAWRRVVATEPAAHVLYAPPPESRPGNWRAQGHPTREKGGEP